MHDTETAKLKTPISVTSPDCLVPTLKQQRLRNKVLENMLKKMRCEIDKSGKVVKETLERDLITIYSNIANNEIPFMKLSWEEQQNYLQEIRLE